MSAARAAVRGRRAAARSTCPTQLARALRRARSGFEEPRLFANFVASADGVVAIPSLPQSNKLIAGGSAADRFVMGLLRACADVVVIGSGTLLASPSAALDAGAGVPRRRRGLRRAAPPARPSARARGRGALGERLGRPGASGLRARRARLDDRRGRRVPRRPSCPRSSVVSLGPGPFLDIAARGRDAARARPPADPLGGRPARVRLAARGGARGRALPDRVAAPRRAARRRRAARAVEEADLLPGGPAALRLLGVRRDGEHLFLATSSSRVADDARAGRLERDDRAAAERRARASPTTARSPRRSPARPYAHAVADVDDRAHGVLDHVHRRVRRVHVAERDLPRVDDDADLPRALVGRVDAVRRSRARSRVSSPSAAARDAADHVGAGERRDEDVGRVRDEAPAAARTGGGGRR